MSTKPEGEGKVNRRASTAKAAKPEFYETVVERPPKGWNLPDPVQQALEATHMGWEVLPGQAADAVRVRIRCPYANYEKSIEDGKKKANEMTRKKLPGAAVDNYKREALDIQGLSEGKDEAKAQEATNIKP